MRFKAFWPVLLFVTLIQAMFSVAFALDVKPVIPADGTGALDVASQLWQFVVTKQYALALGPVVALIVWALRKYDVLIPKYGAQIDAFLNQPVVAFLLPTLVAAVGGVGTALAAHQPPLDIIKSVFEAAMSAVFTYVGLKKVAEQKAAGATAAAAVAEGGKAAAIEELKKP